jgi:hypothetical protein
MGASKAGWRDAVNLAGRGRRTPLWAATLSLRSNATRRRHSAMPPYNTERSAGAFLLARGENSPAMHVMLSVLLITAALMGLRLAGELTLSALNRAEVRRGAPPCCGTAPFGGATEFPCPR